MRRRRTGLMPELFADFSSATEESIISTLANKKTILESVLGLAEHRRHDFDIDTVVIPTKYMDVAKEALHDAHHFGLGTMRVFASDLLEPVCPVQIDPKFPWITPEGRARINAKFVEMFGKTQDVAYMFNAEVLRDITYGTHKRLEQMALKVLMGE